MDDVVKREARITVVCLLSICLIFGIAMYLVEMELQPFKHFSLIFSFLSLVPVYYVWQSSDRMKRRMEELEGRNVKVRR